MARVPPPRKSAKGVAPPVIALANLDKRGSAALTPMHFRVPVPFHQEFKVYAVQHGMTMVELVQESFKFFRDNQGH